MSIKDAINNAPTLEAKAETIDDLLWNNCRSPEGLLYCFVMADTLTRPTIDEVYQCAPDPDALEGRDRMYDDEVLDVRWVDGKPQYLLQGIPIEDVEAYEDSLSSTGLYLSSLCFRYHATHDGEILKRAATVFDGLYKVYELGLQEQPGWIPKPYGFQCTKQSSMDNQCPYYQSMIRYYPLASQQDKERIVRVLKDEMDYWIRNKYKMHLSYFGIDVDYESDEHYPGHWPLCFLPLCDAVYKFTGDAKYLKEFEYLCSRLTIEKGKDPEHLLQEICCLHRWYYELGALLEQDAKYRERWLMGLEYQIKALTHKQYLGYQADMQHHKWIWLEPHEDKDRTEGAKKLMAKQFEDFLWVWPPHYPPFATLKWRDRAIYMTYPTTWIETYWKGKMRGDW